MLFNSFVFAVFFVVVYGLYLACRRRLTVQNLLLLAASYFFYGWWDWRFLGLIVLSTVIDFVCGRALDQRRPTPTGTYPRTGPTPVGNRCPRGSGIGSTESPDPEYAYAHSRRVRRLVLGISVGANLGILGFFKYFDFFATGCAQLLESIGLPLQPRLLEIMLPVGISFYTFQTLSYSIDVYRGRIGCERQLLNFAVFVAFFPQLVAGPILRAADFLPQVRRPRRLQLDQFYEGGYLILWGLFKKVVIADNLAVLVDGVFGADPLPHGGAVLVAVYAFAIQIYCDFSGYTDIARGVAKMMGFDIPLNFRLPYFARNPSELWQRWHISLSSWLRDYLYIPLGGNRKGPRRRCINLGLTMLLGGLWHGAAWPFVLWGAYHGALLMAYQVVGSLRAPARPTPRHDWLRILVFFHFTCLGYLIFRAESVGQIGQLLGALATAWPWWILCGANTLGGIGLFTLLVYACPLVLLQLAQYRKDDLNLMLRWPAYVRGLAYGVMFYGLVLYGGQGEQPFIYFQF